MEIVHRLARHPIVRQQGKFLTVGVIATVVDFGTFNLLRFRMGVASIPALTAGFVLAVVVNFALNRSWTFRMVGPVNWLREAVPFLAVSLTGWGLQAASVWAAERWLSDGVIVLNVAKIAGVGAIWFVKFFIFRNFVFVDRRPPEVAKEAAETEDRPLVAEGS